MHPRVLAAVWLGLLVAGAAADSNSDVLKILDTIKEVIAVQSGARPGAASVKPAPAWFPTSTCNDSPGEPTTNCLKCNRFDTACELCLGNQYLTGEVCRRCTQPLCLHCGPLANSCRQCMGVPASDPYSASNPGYPVYKNYMGQCTRCTAQEGNVGCLQCNKWGTTCTLCDDGYVKLADGTCKKCDDDLCKTCNEAGQCLECQQLPHIQYEDGQPVGGGYGVDPQNSSCRRCASPGCLKCPNNYAVCATGGCQDGLPGAGERGFGRDLAAPTTCAACADPRCAVCQPDYRGCSACFTDTDPNPYLWMGKCLDCTIPGCVQCQVVNRNGGTICKECRDGFIANGRGGCDVLPKCSDPHCIDCRGNPWGCNRGGCSPGYGTNGRGPCQKCTTLSCQDCTAPSTCTKCNFGWGLVRGRCVECATNAANVNPEYSFCQTCNGDPARCTECWPSDEFKPNPWTGVCERYAVVQ